MILRLVVFDMFSSIVLSGTAWPCTWHVPKIPVGLPEWRAPYHPSGGMLDPAPVSTKQGRNTVIGIIKRHQSLMSQNVKHHL